MLPGRIPLLEGFDLVVLEDELEDDVDEKLDPEQKAFIRDELLIDLSGNGQEQGVLENTLELHSRRHLIGPGQDAQPPPTNVLERVRNEMPLSNCPPDSRDY